MIAYAESIEKIAGNMEEIHPTIITAVRDCSKNVQQDKTKC